jgi:electron transfer flavoprotein alpha/beta subunit
MNLFVCFKVYSDLSTLKSEDLEFTGEMGVDTHFLPNSINCFDESSLEYAIRISEKYSFIHKTAFTLSNTAAIPTLQTLISLGYEDVVRVEADNDDIIYNPELVSKNITNYIKKHPQDVILVGREAPLGNNASTGQLIAEELNYPLFASVIDILDIDEKELIIRVENNGLVYEQKIKTPCVLSVGNAVISKLRMPTLRQRMNNKSRTIETVALCDCESITFEEPIKRYRPNRRRNSRVFNDKNEISELLKNELSKRIQNL